MADGLLRVSERSAAASPASLTPASPGLALWGGVECTVNRVGDRYHHQLERSGHAERPEDLERFAGLGIRALRYPVLWERVAPNGLESADWRWTDERLGRLRELGITPIVGLVHHGSGPRDTSLVDPAFPERLAAFARAVAERYPWVTHYTPVNEPMTTARFSGLYGYWYPHGVDERTFAQALLTQVRAVVLAMRAIREVRPDALLVQTEDLGKTHSTRALAHQAEFENERRWATWDLLCGRLGPGVRMWHHLQWAGMSQEEVDWFAENPCPPGLLGVNHYQTSERFLDERLDRYPARTHGSNGLQTYADVEAVRVSAPGVAGPYGLLGETWGRYGLPMAVTEAHLGSTREEQIRWLVEVWDAARAARIAGADVRAVTVWSLLGAFDWTSLLTREDGTYEPGAFDVRAPAPRPTAITQVARDLAAGRRPRHPALAGRGWWGRREKRLLYAASRPYLPVADWRGRRRSAAQRPILISGATGTLGQAFARLCDHRGLAHVVVSRQEMDVAAPESVAAALEKYRPWAAINAAGYVRVDAAEQDAERCFRENAAGPAVLAAECATRGIQLVTFSSDLVFDGGKGEPYVESDTPAPLNVYGASKAEAERRVLAALPDRHALGAPAGALVVRTSAFFGPWDAHNFVTLALSRLAAGLPFEAANDQVVSPTYVPDLVHACLDLLIDGEQGLWHLANEGAVTWLELAERAAVAAGVSAECLEGRSTAELGLAAARPRYGALGSERGWLLPSLDVALGRYLMDCRVAGTNAAWQEVGRHGGRGDSGERGRVTRAA